MIQSMHLSNYPSHLYEPALYCDRVDPIQLRNITLY